MNYHLNQQLKVYRHLCVLSVSIEHHTVTVVSTHLCHDINIVVSVHFIKKNYIKEAVCVNKYICLLITAKRLSSLDVFFFLFFHEWKHTKKQLAQTSNTICALQLGVQKKKS